MVSYYDVGAKCLRTPDLLESVFAGTDCVVIVVDPFDMATPGLIDQWRGLATALCQSRSRERLPVFLLLNKCEMLQNAPPVASTLCLSGTVNLAVGRTVFGSVLALELCCKALGFKGYQLVSGKLEYLDGMGWMDGLRRVGRSDNAECAGEL